MFPLYVHSISSILSWLKITREQFGSSLPEYVGFHPFVTSSLDCRGFNISMRDKHSEILSLIFRGSSHEAESRGDIDLFSGNLSFKTEEPFELARIRLRQLV